MIGWASRLMAIGTGVLVLVAHQARAGEDAWLKLASVKTGQGLATEFQSAFRRKAMSV